MNTTADFADIATTDVIRWARRAGQIALRHFRRAVPQTKPDQTLLTQADLEIERYLVEQIAAAHPGHAILTEEGNHRRGDGSSPYVWAIDPLDGTTAFVKGLPIWGISIGLLRDARPIWGLFYMPLFDDMTLGSAAGGAQRPARSRVRARWARNDFLAITMTTHADFDVDVRRTCATGSVAASLVYTARGTSKAAFIPKAYAWDLVAGAAILAESGGVLHYLSGPPVDYRALLDGSRAPEPILAGPPELLGELRRRIRTR